MTAIRRNGLRGLLFAVAAGVCLAQMPPSDSGQFAAKVASLTGRVSVLKDNQPWALSVGDAVQVRQIIVASQRAPSQSDNAPYFSAAVRSRSASRIYCLSSMRLL